MKKLILATMMLCASTAQAADWSPVFKGWLDHCQSFEHPVAKAVYEASSDDVPFGDYEPELEITDAVLSMEGWLGDYSTVPMPYRLDLLPATHLYLHHDYFNFSGGVYIPLQNAKFYHLSLYGIAFIGNSLDWYSALNFGKYSKAKERQLEKIIKPLQEKSAGISPSIVKADNNELILSCNVTLVG